MMYSTQLQLILFFIISNQILLVVDKYEFKKFQECSEAERTLNELLKMMITQ